MRNCKGKKLFEFKVLLLCGTSLVALADTPSLVTETELPKITVIGKKQDERLLIFAYIF